MEISRPPGRDPVSKSIEALLRELEADGHGEFQVTDKEGVVCLGFGDLRVEAQTFDIALVRLASAMIDDPRYCTRICDLLRGPLHADTSKFQAEG